MIHYQLPVRCHNFPTEDWNINISIGWILRPRRGTSHKCQAGARQFSQLGLVGLDFPSLVQASIIYLGHSVTKPLAWLVWTGPTGPGFRRTTQLKPNLNLNGPKFEMQAWPKALEPDSCMANRVDRWPVLSINGLNRFHPLCQPDPLWRNLAIWLANEIQARNFLCGPHSMFRHVLAPG